MISGIVTLALALGATAQTQNNRISNSDPFKDEEIWNGLSLANYWAWINPGPCDNDVTAIACRSFKNDGDFTVEQSQNSGVDQVYDVKSFLPYNKALMAVSTDPWNKLATGSADRGFGQDTDGCVFYEDTDGSQENVRLTGSSEQSGNRHKCFSVKAYGCNTVQNGDGPPRNRYWWKNKNDSPSNRDATEHEDSDHGNMYAWNPTKNRWEINPAQVAATSWGTTYRMVVNGHSGRDGLIHATNRVTLKHLVNSLNTLGAVDLYYHRVQRNPIKGVDLKWIAENACKVSMPVSFQCTGSDCVEVQNIVCASFAGIDSEDFGVVSIECKVPPAKFVINSSKKTCRDSQNQFRDNDKSALDGVSTNQPGGNGNQETIQCGPGYARADKKFRVTQDGGNMRIRGNNAIEFQFGQGPNQACSQGTCSITVKSKRSIPQDSNIEGAVHIHADVKSLNQQPRKWSEKLNHFHTAEYNLTRESAPEKVLEMPIGVNFYTDHCGQKDLNNPHPSGDNVKLCKKQTLRDTVKQVARLFPNGIDSVPFLSKQEVNLGQIKKNVHGYFRMVAKVKAQNTWFLSREVTALEVSENGSDDSDFSETKRGGQKYYNANKCTNVDKRDRDVDTARVAADGYQYSRNSDFHTKQKFPVAYLSCPLLMRGMKAGWVMRVSLAWQLSSLSKNDAGYTGKAQLLQDAEEADPNAQSVEVQVTIQLGGG